MPNLWGRQFSRAELMARIGDVSQVGGVREYRLDGGTGDGLPVVDVNTGSGSALHGHSGSRPGH